MATSETALKHFFAKLTLSGECFTKMLEPSNVLLLETLELTYKLKRLLQWNGLDKKLKTHYAK